MSGVVKRLGAATVLRADVGAPADQRPCEIMAVAGGGDMESGVADIEVVLDLREVVVLSVLAGRCVLRLRSRQLRRRREQFIRGCRVPRRRLLGPAP
jgi:hypothetical protein